MQVGEERRRAVVDLWVVFHRAGAERVHTRVARVVELREMGVVTHHLRLGELGETERRGPRELCRNVARLLRTHMTAAPAGARQLEEERLPRGAMRGRA